MNPPSPSLRNELGNLPVVDAHEHLRAHAQCEPRTDVTGWMIGSYMASILPYADRALARRVGDAALADTERWEAFRKIWPLVRYTGYGRLVSGMLGQWGIADDLDAASYDHIRERLHARSPEGSERAYRDAHIEATVTHYLAHPSCGGLENVKLFLEGELAFGTGFRPLLGTLPLHEFMERADLECLEQVSGCSIASLDELVRAVEGLSTVLRSLSASIGSTHCVCRRPSQRGWAGSWRTFSRTINRSTGVILRTTGQL